MIDLELTHITSDDYFHFKQLLTYFVHLLHANHKAHKEQFKKGEVKTGQGNKGQRIQQEYKQNRYYKTGIPMDVNITGGFQLFAKTCYINWERTGMNIRAKWNSEKTAVSGLQLFNNEGEKGFFVGEEIPLDLFSLNDHQEPNAVVKQFYRDFVSLLQQSNRFKEKKGEKEKRMEEKKNKIDPFILECVSQLTKGEAPSYNMVLRGAPGTGKSYLAKQMAAVIISNGQTSDVKDLTEQQKEQMAFVQFHPSYDYTDFVEGLRPKLTKKEEMTFHLTKGIFYTFIDHARDNFENAKKTREEQQNEEAARLLLENYLEQVVFQEEKLQLIQGNSFFITDSDAQFIYLSIPKNKIIVELKISKKELIALLSSKQSFTQVKEITTFFNKKYASQHYSYELALLKDINKKGFVPDVSKKECVVEKPYVFIIDEMNRGELSKIFGELFFSIDPNYRGKSGGVRTQYANLHEESEPTEFYIPENVYIIGTMNDIDRSVDPFDFAMRRRFTFVEITAEKSAEVMLTRKDVKDQMKRLNEALLTVGELSKDYQIGASYFKDLKQAEKNDDTAYLWHQKLYPLLQDYVKGQYEADKKLNQLKAIYFDEKKRDDTNQKQEED